LQGSFGLPVTLTTARQLEAGFNSEQNIKELASLQTEKIARNKKQLALQTKIQTEQLRKIATQKYGNDDRFKTKFVEIANKL
jgi:hypothetical protein